MDLVIPTNGYVSTVGAPAHSTQLHLAIGTSVPNFLNKLGSANLENLHIILQSVQDLPCLAQSVRVLVHCGGLGWRTDGQVQTCWILHHPHGSLLHLDVATKLGQMYAVHKRKRIRVLS